MNDFPAQPQQWSSSSFNGAAMFGQGAHEMNGWTNGGRSPGPSYMNGTMANAYEANAGASFEAGGTEWQPDQTGLLGKRGRELMDEGMNGGSMSEMGMDGDGEQMTNGNMKSERSNLRLAKRQRSELRIPTTDHQHAQPQPNPDLSQRDRSGSFTNVVIQRTGSMTLETDEHTGDQQQQSEQKKMNHHEYGSPLGHGQTPTYQNPSNFLLNGNQQGQGNHPSSAFGFGPGPGLNSPPTANSPASDVPSSMENSQILAQMPKMIGSMGEASSSGLVPIMRGGGVNVNGNENGFGAVNGYGSGQNGYAYDGRMDSMHAGTPRGQYGPGSGESMGTSRSMGIGMGLGFPPGAPPPSLRSISIEAEPYWIDGMHGRETRVVSSGSMSPDIGRGGGARVLDAVVIEDDVDMLPSSPELPAVPPGSRSNSFGAGNLIGPTDLTMSSFTKGTGRTRYMQGPRADCAKCEAGVPGHYGHWA